MSVFTNKIASVYRLTLASSKESYVLNGVISCYVTPLSAEDAFLGEGNPAQSFKLITDYSSDIKKTDKILYDSQNYIVVGMQKFDFGGTRRIEAILELFNS